MLYSSPALYISCLPISLTVVYGLSKHLESKSGTLHTTQLILHEMPPSCHVALHVLLVGTINIETIL